MEPRLEALEQAYQGCHLLDGRHLRQRDRAMRGKPAAASLDQRRHEPLERAGRPRGSFGRERLDADAEERGQAVLPQPRRHLRRSRACRPILLFFGSGAEPVLEVDSEILDGLAPELLLQPREQMFVDVAVERRSERRGVGGLIGQGRSEEHTSELQSLAYLVCRLLLEKKTTT